VAYLDVKRDDAESSRSNHNHLWAFPGRRLPSTHGVDPRRGLPRPVLCRVLDAIHGRLGEKITLQDIADAACMSRFHFARLFRHSTGCSPMEYLLHTRLEQAKVLLRQGITPISDIAAAIGFADQSHLTRHFRRAVGMTPLQYARQCADAGARGGVLRA
jgi:AraC family transcriptional regulator